MLYHIRIVNQRLDILEGDFYSIFFDEQKEIVVLCAHSEDEEWKHGIIRYVVEFRDIESIEIDIVYEDNKPKIPRC